ncbi:MAG: LysM peptidoglycan-binding domain-containing protein [Candidatus Woesearchaeota archaeon]|jgi:nucleoid-associated protein YgaU
MSKIKTALTTLCALVTIGYSSSAKGLILDDPLPMAWCRVPVSHTVTHGENLWDIADLEYGNPQRYVDIVRENHLSDPSLILPGTNLILPGLYCNVRCIQYFRD